MPNKAKDPICGMTVDTATALKLKAGSETFYFCSERCLEKFAKDKGIAPEKSSCASCAVKAPFYKNKTFIVASVIASLIALSFIFPPLVLFRKAFTDYLKIIWWAVLLGLFLGGLIDHYVPREYISGILARPGKRSIFNAVLLGFLMSACSHGILALSIQLHKKGASNPSVVAFLLASPWANAAITVMLIGFFGMKALYIIICSILIAVTTGLIFQVLERKGLIETNNNIAKVDKDFSIKADIAKRVKEYRFSADGVKSDIKGVWSGAVSLGDMVLWWILIGMGIASMAGAYIPPEVFHKYMGPGTVGLVVTLALATIIEVCSEGSSPMAFEIYKQTGAFGNSFVFLQAGVGTDYTEIGLIWANIGRRTAIWLPIVAVPQVIIYGVIANLLF